MEQAATKVTILVAAHKPYSMPDDSIYRPILVGAAQHANVPNEHWLKDETGRNISQKNAHYNELTALYWAKYNLKDQEVIGLAHYRRFLGRKMSHQYTALLTQSDIEQGLAQADVLLPKARNYWIETQAKHYLNAHAKRPLEVLSAVITKHYPRYQAAFEQVQASKKAHLFNMSIMRQADFQAYTDFMFGVLELVDDQLDYVQLTGEDQRALGFLGERLMDVWLIANEKRYLEYPLVTLEKTNWLNKGWHFLRRHFSNSQNKKTHF